MYGTIRARSKHKTRLLLVASLVCYALLAAYMHLISLRSPYIGLSLTADGGAGWTVTAVEEGGKAEQWGIAKGDRVAMVEGRPTPKLEVTEAGTILRKAEKVVVRTREGNVETFRSAPGEADVAEASFAIGMELILLGIGLYALRKMPQSRIARLFYLLNWLMALCILTQFTMEKSLADLVIACCAIWLPHCLLSFYLLLAFRTEFRRFRPLSLGSLAIAVAWSAYLAYLLATGGELRKGVEDLLNWAVIGILVLLAGVTVVLRRSIEPMKRSQLLILFGGAFLSLLPYLGGYAVPTLVGRETALPIRFALIGLLPLSGTLTYWMSAKGVVNARVRISGPVVHAVYFGASFGLIAFAARGVSAPVVTLLFAAFALLTWAYRLALSRRRRTALEGRSLLEAQHAERMRVTYYLHDQLLQNLIFLSRDLEELHDAGAWERERVAAWLECVYDSQRGIRMLCDDLYPPIVDKGDLKEALQWLLRTMRDKGGIQTELQYELRPGEPADELVKTNLFRAIREFVHNAFKHARATRLHIRLWRDREAIVCTVGDDGQGFDVAAALAPGAGERRFGLLSACSQIRHLGGETDIRTLPGGGTLITIRLPQEKEKIAHA
ncbi:ATP-binding protein [Cohnella sp. REN36]|uniref:ATP-binding protein n=1 Tax=Cohnella sp. REN36 TaxID=2887347 RepID=UPI001D141549|nr:ATP-binding protein [Cohnella sp. REN36]MCC3375196.1 hypothetical protein [Cohnella sp. REN36]